MGFLEKIFDISDALFFAWIGFIAFSRYLVRPSEFYPSSIYQFFFSQVSYLGFSPTARLFWIGAGLLTVSIGLRVLSPVFSWLAVFISERFERFSLVSDGEKYLKEHGVESFD